MHILQLSTGYPPQVGGVYRNTRQCALALAQDHRVTVLVPNSGRRTVREVVEGVEVIRAGTWGVFRSQHVAPRLITLLRGVRPDLIHLHVPNPLAVVAYLASAPDVPVVVTHHADITRQRLLKPFVMPAYRRVLEGAQGVIFYTRQFADACTDARGVEAKTAIIPMGLDESVFVETPEAIARAAALRRRLAGDAPTVSLVGRLAHYKGIDILLRALVELPGVHALIGGTGSLRSDLESEALKLGIAERVHFLGYLDEATKRDVYRAGDVFAMPSINQAEAFGQTQVEAQLSRRPIVASRLPGVGEVTVDGMTGLLVPPMDVGALAGALRRLLSDPELRLRMGEAGRARAEANYTEAVAGAKLRAYFGALEGAERAPPRPA